jgi:hypothetical protein
MIALIFSIGVVSASNADSKQVVKPPGFSITLVIDVNTPMPAALAGQTVSSSESTISTPPIYYVMRNTGATIPKCKVSEAGNRIQCAQYLTENTFNTTPECTARSGSL